MQLVKRILPLAAFFALSTAAQTPATPSGHWEGTVQAPTAELKVVFDFARSGNGDWFGTIGNPTEGVEGLPFATVVLDGKALRFQVGNVGNERLFQGTISADGMTISGTFSQFGYPMPFVVVRTGEAKLEQPKRLSTIAKEWEGAWNGTMELEGRQERFVLTMLNKPDGTAAGTLVSAADGLEIPVANVTQSASTLTLDLKAVGGSYSGSLNADKMELAGNYTKGSLVVPLTFRRAPETKNGK